MGLLGGFSYNTVRTPRPSATGWSHVQRYTTLMDFQMCSYSTMLPSPSPITPTRLCFVSRQSIEPWWPPVVGLGPSFPLFLSSQSLLPLMISQYHLQEQLGAVFICWHSQGTHPLELQPSLGATRHPLDIRRLGCCPVLISCSPDIWPAIWNCLSLSPESDQQLLVASPLTRMQSCVL